jgi:hypothetical protein
LLLAKQGLLKLKDPTNISATRKDIIENPKNLKFKELEAATLPRVLNQVDVALINTNYAIEAKLNPVKDSLFIEDANSPYANLLVAREDNKNSPAFKKLIAALNSPEVKRFIEENTKVLLYRHSEPDPQRADQSAKSWILQRVRLFCSCQSIVRNARHRGISGLSEFREKSAKSARKPDRNDAERQQNASRNRAGVVQLSASVIYGQPEFLPTTAGVLC